MEVLEIMVDGAEVQEVLVADMKDTAQKTMEKIIIVAITILASVIMENTRTLAQL